MINKTRAYYERVRLLWRAIIIWIKSNCTILFQVKP